MPHTQPVSHGPHSALVVLKERNLACSPQTTQNTDRRRHVACECVTGNESTLGTSLKSRSWLVLRHKDARVKIRAGVDINPAKYSATSWSLPHTYCYQPFKPPRKIHKNLIIECHLNQNGVVYLISTVPNPIWMAQYRSWNQNRGGTSRNLYRRDTAFQYSGYLLNFFRCLQTLASYTPPKLRYPYPMSRCAAVLVALFVGRMGDLYVLLNR